MAGHAFLAGSVALLLAAACTRPPAPPAGTRGGDVAPGAGLEGASRYVPVDSPGCRGRRIVNTRFDRIGLRDPGYLVVETSTDVVERDCAEGSQGTVRVRTWDDARLEAPRSVIADSGELAALAIPEELQRARAFVPLLRITRTGCCGSLDLDAYYDLVTGRPAFAASSPLRWFIANGTVRYLAVLTQAPRAPVERWSPGTVAVLQYGTGSGPAQRLEVPGDTSFAHYVAENRLAGPMAPGDTIPVLAGRSERDTVAVSGIRWRVDIRPQGDGPGLGVSAVIRDDRLVLERVTPLRGD